MYMLFVCANVHAMYCVIIMYSESCLFGFFKSKFEKSGFLRSWLKKFCLDFTKNLHLFLIDLKNLYFENLIE